MNPERNGHVATAAPEEHDADRLPWEQEPSESQKWFSRFERYRLQGPARAVLAAYNAERTEQGTARERKPAQSPAASWTEASHRFRWRERAEAWDRHQRALARAAQEQERVAMLQRHARAAETLFNKALERLEKLDADQLGPRDVLAFLDGATRLERLARGEPETTSADSGTPQVVFTLEDALEASKRFAEWKRERGFDAPPVRSGGLEP